MDAFILFGHTTNGPFLTENVEIVEKWDGYIRGADQMGYGSKIQSRYMIRRKDEKIWRRVYLTQWGNCASHWIKILGEKIFISITL